MALSIISYKNRSRLKVGSIFIGFAEFDDVEGPIISVVIPPSFPLDIENNYRIADYALYIQNKVQFETERFIIYAFPFKVYDNNYERKVRYYSIIIGCYKEHKELLETKKDLINMKIDSYIAAAVNAVISRDSRGIREILLNIYHDLVAQKEEPKVSGPFVEKIGNNFNYRSHSGEASARSGFFMIDVDLGIIINYDSETVNIFYSEPENFNITYDKSLGIFMVKRKINNHASDVL